MSLALIPKSNATRITRAAAGVLEVDFHAFISPIQTCHSYLARGQSNIQASYLCFLIVFHILICLELQRNPASEVSPSGEVTMSDTNIIPETTPSYFWHQMTATYTSLLEMQPFWQLFWKPNSAHSMVPVMDKTSVDRFFEAFKMDVMPQNECGYMNVAEITTPPAVTATIFATLALSAQCHEKIDIGSKFYICARNAAERVVNRNSLEHLLAVTLLV